MSDKAKAVVALAESKLGDPYVFGARGEKCTTGIRRQYAAYHPEYRDKIFGACPVLSGKQGSCDGCKWQGHNCYDCRGFTYYVLRTAAQITINGGGATTQYDTKSNWALRGTTDKMPDLVCCVFKRKSGKMSHTGLHVGGGRIIHCSTIVKEGSTTDKTWTHFGIPLGLYTDEEIKKAGGIKLKATIRRGAKGDEVRTLQLDLYWLGWVDLAVDGAFGPKTDQAVREFQAKSGIAVDGIVGPKTWEALDGMLASTGHAEMVEEPEPVRADPDPEPEAEQAQPAAAHVFAELTLANEPITVTYPAGQEIRLSREAAEDICGNLQYALANGAGDVSIIAPMGCEVTLTAIGAMNVWQQIRDEGDVSVG